MPLDEMEYEALQAEKRDKMNARWQVWSILISLTGVFGLVSLQMSGAGYIIGLYPLLAACLARFSAHSESVLDQIKAYLLTVEEKHSYVGYEHFNRGRKRTTSGSHMKALRDAIFCTDLLAVVVLIVHVYVDHVAFVALPILLIEGAMFYKTFMWLKE